MVTSNTSVHSSRPGLRPWRLFAYFVFILVLVIFAGLVWVYSVAHSALPQLDGKLQVSGLSLPVTVTRDSHGIPVIEAASLDDLFFSQGYVTASDRMFQMDGM